MLGYLLLHYQSTHFIYYCSFLSYFANEMGKNPAKC